MGNGEKVGVVGTEVHGQEKELIAELRFVRETQERKKEGDEGLPDGRELLPQKPGEGRTMRAWSGVSCPIITRQ